jgi:two-component system, OmpR family, sensor histidine kinase SenX3
MRRKLEWILYRGEFLAAGFVLVSLGALTAWWSILLRRVIAANDELSRQMLALKFPDDADALQAGLGIIQLRTERLSLMVAGETAVFVAGLSFGVVVLLGVARRRRQARERMEQLLRLTSHELKTPIAGVRALLQSLELGSVPEEQRAQLTRMGILECDRLEHLAETVLAYQRAVSRQAKDLEVSSALALVDEVLEHRQRTRIAETVVRAELAPAQLRVDKDAFRVIFENLLDNVRKYGGGQAQLHASIEGRRWRLSVSDKGQGFAPQDAERLFDPFRREKTASMTHGSGLGLSIARQLARQMGGDLTARSDGPQSGATFVLALPVVSAEAVVARG